MPFAFSRLEAINKKAELALLNQELDRLLQKAGGKYAHPTPRIEVDQLPTERCSFCTNSPIFVVGCGHLLCEKAECLQMCEASHLNEELVLDLPNMHETRPNQRRVTEVKQLVCDFCGGEVWDSCAICHHLLFHPEHNPQCQAKCLASHHHYAQSSSSKTLKKRKRNQDVVPGKQSKPKKQKVTARKAGKAVCCTNCKKGCENNRCVCKKQGVYCNPTRCKCQNCSNFSRIQHE